MNQKNESIEQKNGKIGSIIKIIIEKSYYYVVSVLFAMITLWLFGINIFSTSYMISDATEHTYFSEDNVWINILMLFAFCVILLIVYKTKLFTAFRTKLSDDKFFIKITRIMMGILALEGIFLILSLQCIPRWDQKFIMDAAHDLQFKQYAAFEPGGYIEKYPYQLGIVLFIYFLSKLFGANNYIIFQLINVICLIIIYKSFDFIAKHLGMGRLSRFMIYFYGILYFPLTFYVLFIYGNIIGFAFALAAICFELQFLDRKLVFEEITKKGKSVKKTVDKAVLMRTCRDMILSALLIVLAVLIKSFYLIFLVGMIIYALIKILTHKKILSVAFFIFIAVFYLMKNTLPDMCLQHISGITLEGGSSSWASIAMGLQDTSGRAKGWYNGYNWTSYDRNNYDPEQQAEEALQIIDERLGYFITNSDAASVFFLEKNASQWNNPTFQCFWLVQTMSSQNVRPLWIRIMTSINGSYVFYRLLDFLQMITLFGACLHLFIRKNKADFGYLFLEMIIIGGFVFHTVWEAKCQYALIYYMLFIPIAIRGYSAFVHKYTITKPQSDKETKVDEIVMQEYRKTRSKTLIKLGAIALITVSLVLLFSLNDTLNFWVNTDKDTIIFAEYVERHRYSAIEDGLYRIHPAEDPTMSIALESIENTQSNPVGISDNDSENCIVRVYSVYNNEYIQFIANSKYLDLHDNDESSSAFVWAYAGNFSVAQQWGFKEAYAGNYYLRIGKKSALAYDKETKSIMVSEFDYADNQQWILEKLEEDS